MDLSPRISEYIQGRASVRLEKVDKEAEKARQKAQAAGDDVAELAQRQAEQRAALVGEYAEPQWLDSAAIRAKQITLATHAAKFSHSDNKASSVAAGYLQPSAAHLGSHQLDEPTLDVVGNAAALDVANLLLLQEGGIALWQQVRAGEDASLRAFSDDESRLAAWLSGLGTALESSTLQSHSLAKQAYFPVGEGTYHLVSPLHASSLSQALYERVQAHRYSEEAKLARGQRKSGKGSADHVVFLMGSASMSYGGSKPQNISLLNSRRGGKAYMLSCAPPTWQAKPRLPSKGKAAFWRMYGFRVKSDIAGLRDYLGRVSDYNNKAVREGRERRVSRLLDQLLQLAAELRELGDAGWSANSSLSLAEQCFLDPDRRELPHELGTEFAHKIDDESWIEEVSESYSRWLNGQLSGMKNSHGVKMRDLGDTEANDWARDLKRAIRRLRNDLEHWT